MKDAELMEKITTELRESWGPPGPLVGVLQEMLIGNVARTVIVLDGIGKRFRAQELTADEFEVEVSALEESVGGEVAEAAAQYLASKPRMALADPDAEEQDEAPSVLVLLVMTPTAIAIDDMAKRFQSGEWTGQQLDAAVDRLIDAVGIEEVKRATQYVQDNGPL